VPEREKRLWLAVADLALNPMTSGGGTNLKLPEYAAAGLPILTTPFGRRGQPLEPGQHCLEAPLEAYPQALAQLPPPDELAALARRARERVLEALDWREIARRAWEAIQTKHHP
jgi:glycosyltransferase involved in cell wall biosynthesis